MGIIDMRMDGNVDGVVDAGHLRSKALEDEPFENGFCFGFLLVYIQRALEVVYVLFAAQLGYVCVEHHGEERDERATVLADDVVRIASHVAEL